MEKEFIFCLSPLPMGVTKEEIYLDCIDNLVTELRNYEKVTIIGDDVEVFKAKQKAAGEAAAYLTIAQKAKSDGRTMQSIIDEYGYEQLGVSEETHKRIGMK